MLDYKTKVSTRSIISISTKIFLKIVFLILSVKMNGSHYFKDDEAILFK